MNKFPQPFFRKARNRWAVEIHGKQVNLGPDRDEAFRRYHELMSAKPEKRKVTSCITHGDNVLALIDTFLEWCTKNKSKRTYEWYLEKTQSFARTIPSELTVEELKPFHVQEWIDSHDSWSSGMKRGCVTAVKRVFNWAVKQGRIDRSPIQHMEKPPEGRRDAIVTPDAYSRMLEFSHESFRDVLTVCWETGCRPQEILRIEARHVDVANSRWVFPVEESKGKKRNRVVYLTPAALKITLRLIEKYPTGTLFRNRNGKPWLVNSIQGCFVRIQIALGREEMQRKRTKVPEQQVRQLADRLTREGKNIRKGKPMPDRELLGDARRRLTNQLAARHAKKYCLYNLRHSWATRALESGVDAVTVSVLMGHADTRMLSRVYQHLDQNAGNLRDALERVEARPAKR